MKLKCKNCGNKFETKYKDYKFCSRKCSAIHQWSKRPRIDVLCFRIGLILKEAAKIKTSLIAAEGTAT